jgi:SagB-type dehydrogenase family enzyme
MKEEAYKGILQYHEETKHHFRRYARSAGYMDWDNQPEPFRFYPGADPVPLPLLEEDPGADYMTLYTRETVEPSPFDTNRIAAFLELSLGLSAWKVSGRTRWSLRINPSSGNLHPTESHLVIPQTDSLQGGVYHYNPLIHGLEPRARIPEDLWIEIRRHLGGEGFFVGLCSIFWRESWKYGERGFRYCQHDTGHALACLSFSAGLQGWKATCLNALAHEDMEKILGFHKTGWLEMEKEEPELLCFVHPKNLAPVPADLPQEIVSRFAALEFRGKPNTLSKKHVRWEIIERVSSLTKKPKTSERLFRYGYRPFLDKAQPAVGASHVIRKRRSAVDFDRKSSLHKDQFLAVLDKTIPRDGCVPFDANPVEPMVDLMIFLHNVEGMESGLYFFFRNLAHKEEVIGISAGDLLWEPVEEGFPLFLLRKGDLRHEAYIISCEQEIAGWGAFSLGMIARFRETIRKDPYLYTHLFWECGTIGQVLYLEAEAHGVRGTGMGCYFDDPAGEAMGLKDNAYQSLYHFAVGSPVEDKRLGTHLPYRHLKR